VASTLVEAHARGLLHRNLKPARVVLQRVEGVGEVPRVYGFGPPAAEFERIVPQGMLFGTPQYMAPEQVGQQAPGPAADRYALGTMLFEALTGAPPFTGETIVALMARKLTEEPPPLPAHGPRGPLSATLRDLVAALLRPRPEDRPPDTVELARRLELLRGAAWAARLWPRRPARR
jgi:serine/threonine-protein kinase